MRIKCLDHITIIVKDLEQSLWFYGELLGLEQLPTVDLGDHVLRYFQIPGGQKIELNQYMYPTEDRKGSPTDKGSYRHMAFEVEDIYDYETHLEKAGIQFHYPVKHDPDMGVTNGLFHDPNGVEIELVEFDRN